MGIQDYSISAAANTSLAGINIGENCPPSGINDAVRQLMADIKGGATLAVDSIAALRAISTSDAEKTPKACHLRGYSTVGDGGEGLFVWIASASHDDDGGVWIKPDGVIGSGRWRRCTNGEALSVKWFGAKGDGVTDDTAAFLAAADHVAAAADWRSGGGLDPDQISVASGTYLVTSDVTFTKGVGLVGPGKVVLTGAQVTIDAGPVTSVLTGIEFRSGDAAPSTKPLVEIKLGCRCRIIGCRFVGSASANGSFSDYRRYGLYAGSAGAFWGSTIQNNDFGWCQVGLRVGNSADQTHNFYANNTIEHNSVAGAILCNPAGGVFVGNSVEHNEGAVGLAITGVTSGSTNNALALSINSNYIFNNGVNYDNASYGILIGYDVPNTTGFDAAGALITSGSFYTGIKIGANYITGTHYARAIKARIFVGADITDNVLDRNASSSFDIEVGGTGAFVNIARNRNQTSGGQAVADLTTAGLGLYATVYLSQSGSDTANTGSTSTDPVKSWATAIARLADGGTVIVTNGPLSQSDASGRIRLAGITISKTCTISVNSGQYINYSAVVLADGVRLTLAGAGTHRFDGSTTGITVGHGGELAVADGVIISRYVSAGSTTAFGLAGTSRITIGNLAAYGSEGGSAGTLYLATSSQGGFINLKRQTMVARSAFAWFLTDCRLAVLTYHAASEFTAAHALANAAVTYIGG